VPVTSSNTGVGVITTSPVGFAANVQFVDTAFDPLTGGTTTIAVAQPAGFTAVVQEISGGNRDIVATVTGGP